MQLGLFSGLWDYFEPAAFPLTAPQQFTQLYYPQTVIVRQVQGPCGRTHQIFLLLQGQFLQPDHSVLNDVYTILEKLLRGLLIAFSIGFHCGGWVNNGAPCWLAHHFFGQTHGF